MIFILLQESDSMVPGKIISSLLDDGDFLSSNSWHLKGRDLIIILSIKWADVKFIVVVVETVKFILGLLGL